MDYFKIVYLLSGKYKSIYKAKILLWQDGRVKIRDEDEKEHVLKEEHLQSIKKIRIKDKKVTIEQASIHEQQKLF